MGGVHGLQAALGPAMTPAQLDAIEAAWAATGTADVPALVAEIKRLQALLALVPKSPF